MPLVWKDKALDASFATATGFLGVGADVIKAASDAEAERTRATAMTETTYPPDTAEFTALETVWIAVVEGQCPFCGTFNIQTRECGGNGDPVDYETVCGSCGADNPFEENNGYWNWEILAEQIPHLLPPYRVQAYAAQEPEPFDELWIFCPRCDGTGALPDRDCPDCVNGIRMRPKDDRDRVDTVTIDNSSIADEFGHSVRGRN